MHNLHTTSLLGDIQVKVVNTFHFKFTYSQKIFHFQLKNAVIIELVRPKKIR